jgi:hypothetical protein
MYPQQLSRQLYTVPNQPLQQHNTREADAFHVLRNYTQLHTLLRDDGHR